MRGVHAHGCSRYACGGCFPLSQIVVPNSRPRPTVPVPPAIAPSARTLLIAFQWWLAKQPSETLGDKEWTAERLADLFIMEAQGLQDGE